MLEAAYILPLVPRLEWYNAVAPASALNAVNFSLPLDVAQYGLRDRQLAYRDLVVGAAIARVAMKVTDIWDFSAPKPILASQVSATLANNAGDYPTTPLACPGVVNHVDNRSLPLNASGVDSQLYARDLLIYQALQQAASALVENPVPDVLVPGVASSDLWALAYGINKSASVGYNLPLSPALFSAPDKYLAWRDNVLAAYVAATVNNLGNVYAVASKLLVQVAGAGSAEPEVYVLTSDDGRYRIWTSQPLIPGKLKLVYDRVTLTLAWSGESLSSVGGPAPMATSFSSSFNSTVTVVGALQGYLDAEFYRQKSARLNVRPWKDQPLFLTAQTQNYVIQNDNQPVVYQTDSVVIPVAGTVAFSTPIQVPSSCVRVGVIVEPSKELDILGFQVSKPVGSYASGTSLVFTQKATNTWFFTLPAGRLFFSLTYHDSTAQTLSFNVNCNYNEVAVFSGSLIYNQAPGTQVTSQLVEVDATGNPCTFTVSWDGAAGQFTLDKLSFFTQAASGEQIEYTLQVTLADSSNSSVSAPLTLSGVPGRVDCAWFDLCIPANLILPTMSLTWWPGGVADQPGSSTYSGTPSGDQVYLYVYAYDVRKFLSVETLPNPTAYDPYKQMLVEKALSSVQQSFSTYQAQQPTDYRTLDSTGAYVWDAAANSAWLSAVSQVETRLFNAFTVGGPGDVGRLALIPAGLQLDQGTRVLATSPLATPVLRTFQPWMSDFGALVAGADFIPMADNGCQSQGVVPFFTDFDVVPTVFGNPQAVPAIVDLQATSYLNGVQNGSEYIAYTFLNSGPSGGTVSQTVSWTATLINLVVGTSYTFTVVTMQTDLTTSASSEVDTVVTFTATSTTQQVSG